MTTRTISLLALLLHTALPLAAQNAPSAESRLREQIKSLAGQLRAAETEKATLATDKAALEDKAKALEVKLADVGKQLVAEAEKARKDGDSMRAQIAAKDAEIAHTKNELMKATDFGTKAAQLAKKTEGERNRLAAENIQLKRTVADQRMKNGKMFEIGNEILTRYEKFGLGTALTAREPFVGITRARLETMVEEYGGKLAEQRVKAAGPPSVAKPSQETSKKPDTVASDSRRAKD